VRHGIGWSVSELNNQVAWTSANAKNLYYIDSVTGPDKFIASMVLEDHAIGLGEFDTPQEAADYCDQIEWYGLPYTVEREAN
jgi:hypothetical protein